MAINVGRVCVKIAGRDAGKQCVIVQILDRNFVMIDGATRRKRCNILHLEPLAKEVAIEENASHEQVAAACKKVGIDVRTSKPKDAAKKPSKTAQTAKAPGAKAAKPAAKAKPAKN